MRASALPDELSRPTLMSPRTRPRPQAGASPIRRLAPALGVLCLVVLAACTASGPARRDRSIGSDGELVDGGRDGIIGDLGVIEPIRWIELPAGSFQMGSPLGENCREPHEIPHAVTLSRSIEMSATEVTQGQFLQLMAYNPSESASYCGINCPVENVSWHEAAAFTNRLAGQASLKPCYRCEGQGPDIRCQFAQKNADGTDDLLKGCASFRLPSEAEWEYAYRAATTSALYAGELTFCTDGRDSTAYADPKTDPYLEQLAWDTAWYFTNASGAPQAVALKKANPWGLFDMPGNVAEWCNDWYAPYPEGAATDPAGPPAGYYRITRGGSCDSAPLYLRAASRMSQSPSFRNSQLGIRVVRVTPAS